MSHRLTDTELAEIRQRIKKPGLVVMCRAYQIECLLDEVEANRARESAPPPSDGDRSPYADDEWADKMDRRAMGVWG